MKTKSFEKLASFQLDNEKLGNVLGGIGAPVKNFVTIEGTQSTGAGEMCWNGQCLSYSSDVLYDNGNYVYSNLNTIDKPC